VLVSVLRSVARVRLVKTGNPSECATVTCKVCKSAIALYLSVIKRTCNKAANKSNHPNYNQLFTSFKLCYYMCNSGSTNSALLYCFTDFIMRTFRSFFFYFYLTYQILELHLKKSMPYILPRYSCFKRKVATFFTIPQTEYVAELLNTLLMSE
jgi:hypothetical protein